MRSRFADKEKQQATTTTASSSTNSNTHNNNSNTAVATISISLVEKPPITTEPHLLKSDGTLNRNKTLTEPRQKRRFKSDQFVPNISVIHSSGFYKEEGGGGATGGGAAGQPPLSSPVQRKRPSKLKKHLSYTSTPNTDDSLQIAQTDRPKGENISPSMSPGGGMKKKEDNSSSSTPKELRPVRRLKAEKSDSAIYNNSNNHSNNNNNNVRNNNKSKITKKQTDKKSPIDISNFSELPLEFQKKVKALKIDEDKINENFKRFIFVARYITKQPFICPGIEIPKKMKIPYLDHDTQTQALHKIHLVDRDKELKKTYKIILTNGKGSYGKVVSARVKVHDERGKQQKELVAIKRVPITEEDDFNICEVACLIILKHTNVVQFKEAYRLPNELWIVMEFMEGGTLNHAIKVHSFSDAHNSYILQQILCGLVYVHSRGFAHRDLKSNNIMMSINGNIKLIDFGICAHVSKPLQETVGTVFWMAPEIILKQPHNEKCDIWSFGIVAVEMFLRAPPFYSSRIMAMWKTVLGESIQCLDESKSKMNNEYYNLCHNCLKFDPEQRPTARELTKIPFIANAELDKSFLTSLKTIFISLTMHRSGF